MNYKLEEVKQMKSHMFKTFSWLNVRSKAKDKKCSECKRKYEDMLDDNIGLLIPMSGTNEHLCQSCIEKYIELGVEDLYIKGLEQKASKETLIEYIIEKLDILKIGYKSKWSAYHEDKLNKKSINELNDVASDLDKKIEYKNFIDSIDSSDWELEDYLIEQYDVYMNKKYLKHESQIEEYFSTDMSDYFDCGQGYFQDTVKLIVKIEDKFYSVTIHAEIGSSKQNYGDRLYWVEGIELVEYEEIEKPKQKKEKLVHISIMCTDDEEKRLHKLIKENFKNYEA